MGKKITTNSTKIQRYYCYCILMFSTSCLLSFTVFQPWLHMDIDSLNCLTCCSNLTKSNLATFCVVIVLFILQKLHLRSLADTDIVHSVVLSNFNSDIFFYVQFLLGKNHAVCSFLLTQTCHKLFFYFRNR